MGLTLKYAPAPTRHPRYRAAAAAREVPIGSVADRCYLLADGSLAAVFRVKGFQYELASPREMADYCTQLRKIINNLPPGVTLGHRLYINHNVRPLLEEHDACLDGEQPYARWLAWERARGFHEQMRGGELLHSENVLVVTYNPDGNLLQRFSNWMEGGKRVRDLQRMVLDAQKKDTIVQRSTAAYTLALQKFEEVINPVMNQMNLAGLEPERLDDDGLYELAWTVLNPEEALSRGCPKIERPKPGLAYAGLLNDGQLKKALDQRPDLALVAPVTEREQLCVTDMVEGDSWVRIGAKYYGAVVLKKLPTHHYPTLALTLAVLPFEATVSMDLVMLEKHREQEKMWARVRSAKSRAEVSLFGGTPDPARREQAQQWEQLYLQLSSGDENPLACRMVIVVAAASRARLNKACDTIIATLREMEGAQGERVRYQVKDAIQTTWPFAKQSLQFSRQVLTSQAADLMPLFGRWRGSERAVTLCTDPVGHLIAHDPFPENLLSRNKVVTGMTGSGKSFMQQQLDIMPQAARANSEILIVESGGSFELTCELLGGKHIRLGPRSKVSINPFDLPDGFDAMAQEEQEAQLRYKMQFIKGLVLAMARLKDPESQQIAETVVGVCVRRCYEKERVPMFRHFYAELGAYRNDKDRKAEELAGRLRTLLANYVVHESGEEGMYAKYFDTRTDFNVSVSPLGFDLIDVKNDPALLTPYSLVVIGNLIYNRLMLRDGRARVVVVDEAWALIKEEGGEMSPAGKAIELFFREGRKMGASTCFITQAAADCAGDAIGRSVVNNSAIQYYLVHERTGANDRAFGEMGFTKAKTNRVYDAKTVPGKYSEVMIKEGAAWGMLRVPSGGPHYWLATTNHIDLKVRARYFATYGKVGLSREAIIAILAKDYPQGAATLKGRDGSAEEMPVAEGIRYGTQWEDHFRRFAERVAGGERIAYTFR